MFYYNNNIETLNRRVVNMKEKYEAEFKYLENLRISGVINMYGAAPYLAAAFAINIDEARTILSDWMNRYDELSKKYGWR